MNNHEDQSPGPTCQATPTNSCNFSLKESDVLCDLYIHTGRQVQVNTHTLTGSQIFFFKGKGKGSFNFQVANSLNEAEVGEGHQ